MRTYSHASLSNAVSLMLGYQQHDDLHVTGFDMTVALSTRPNWLKVWLTAASVVPGGILPTNTDLASDGDQGRQGAKRCGDGEKPKVPRFPGSCPG